MTANSADGNGSVQTSTDCGISKSNVGGLWWAWAYASPAVFKTVCGALLRRPGWVRFPSIPARLGPYDSQVDAMKERASAPVVKG
jgi:hypothetical protein